MFIPIKGMSSRLGDILPKRLPIPEKIKFWAAVFCGFLTTSFKKENTRGDENPRNIDWTPAPIIDPIIDKIKVRVINPAASSPISMAETLSP